MRGAALFVLALAAACSTALTLAACSSPPPIDYDLGIVWKDANGSIADGVTGAPNGPLLYEDHAGLFWRIEPTTAAIFVAIADGALGTYPGYASTDCTGIQYVVSGGTFMDGTQDFPVPRMTFDSPDSSAIHVRPDGLQTVALVRCSVLTGTGCIRTDYGGVSGACAPMPEPALPTAPMLPSPPLSIPVVPFMAPLHPELM